MLSKGNVPPNKCFFCGKPFTELPFRCNYCGNRFCSDHYLPENHNCPKLSKKDWGVYQQEQIRKGKTVFPPPKISPKVSPIEAEKKSKRKPHLITQSWVPPKSKKVSRSQAFKILKNFGGSLSSIFILMIGAIMPFLAGLAFMYLLVPGMAQFANMVGTENTLLLLTVAFLSPFSSMISWLAWIVSGFVAGAIWKRILVPFLITFGLGWAVFYILSGEELSYIMSIAGEETVIQIIALNGFVALLAFAFGGWFGSAIGGSVQLGNSAKLLTLAVVVVVLLYGAIHWGPTILEQMTGGEGPKLLWTYQTEGGIVCPTKVAISADGNVVVAVGGYEIYSLSADGSLRWEYHASGPANDIVLSSDGHYLAAAVDYGQAVLLFSKDNPAPLWTFEEGASSIAMSQDGSVIAVVQNNLAILSPSSNQPLWTYPTNGDVTISADGSRIATGEPWGDKLRVFAQDGSIIYEYSGGDWGWRDVEISSDGKYLVAARNFTTEVCLFSIDNKSLLWTFDPGLATWDIAISENGDYIAVVAGSKLFLLSSSSNLPIWNASVGSVPSVAISADGRHIVVADQEGVKLFTRSSNSPIWKYEEKSGMLSMVSFQSVAISADGKYFVASGSNGKVYFFSSG